MSAFIHDLIKIKYSNEGYLPDWPYHEISDEEMCNAFLSERFSENENVIFSENSSSYFAAMYPLLDDALQDAYNQLVRNITYWLDKCISSTSAQYTLPDWVYQYMIGSVIGVESDKIDIHDLLVQLGVDNIDDDWTADAEIECYRVSTLCMNRIKSPDHRSPTIFGDPLILRYLRLVDDNPSNQISI